MNYVRLLLLVSFAFPFSAKAEEWRFKNEPLCNQIYAVATSALANKNQGVKKETMAAALPKRAELEKKDRTSKVLLGLYMLDILDEVFSSYKLEAKSYSAYRAEICYRSDKGLSIPSSLKEGYKVLASCAELPEPDRIRCGMSAAGTTEEYDS